MAASELIKRLRKRENANILFVIIYPLIAQEPIISV